MNTIITHKNQLRLAVLLVCWAGLMPLNATSAEVEKSKPATAEAAVAAAKDGTLAARLTTPEELQHLLGSPDREQKDRDGDMDILVQEFSDVKATFGRLREPPGTFTLFRLQAAGKEVDIGRGRPTVLRTVDDLSKLNTFWGLAGVSLVKLDLRDQLQFLNTMSFDSLTVWPGADKLPENFSPERLLEEGKNPGLGVRKLHEAGIDGKGIGIAIIDQPLLRDHEEYKDRIIRYEALEIDGVPPQMHGPAVTSIAVGKSCGVAPAAALYYFAVPGWKWTQNEPWAELLERIVELNSGIKETPKIRVVSISLGAFSERRNYERWQQALQKAEKANILVVTCDPEFLRLTILKRIEGRPDMGPSDYEKGRYFHPGAVLCVPAGNRTMASFRGARVYTYDRIGGMSWTVPYLAGLAALGWQVDPNLPPGEMVQLWLKTSTRTTVGPVINPAAVIEGIKARK